MSKGGVINMIVCAVMLGGTFMMDSNILKSQNTMRTANPLQEAIDLPAFVEGYVWDGQEQEIAEGVQRVLETTTILNKSYRAPDSTPLYVSIVYAGKTRRSLHFPEVCIVGQGWQLHQQETVVVGLEFTAKRLVITKGEQKQAVMYYFKTQEFLTANYFTNAWYWSRAQLLGQNPSSSLIRFSTPITEYGEESAFDLLDDAARKFNPVIQENIK